MKTALPSATAVLLAGLAAIVAGGAASNSPTIAATPPPTPPALAAPSQAAPTATPAPESTPIPLPSGLVLPGMASPGPAKPTPSPPPDARKGLEGVWEVQIQHGSKTDYAHFKLDQTGTTLSGTYLNSDGKRFPMAGSIEDQAVRLVVSMPDGTTLLMQARLDGTTDMVGLLTSAQEQVPFTAAYRPKEKWIDNLNASPGGMGGLGSGGGGYPP